MKHFLSSTGFVMPANQESIENLMKDRHQQMVFFGEKMPKQVENWSALRSWVEKRLEKVENYLENLETLHEQVIALCISEEEKKFAKRKPQLALPAADGK
jgi:hypothetical protein